MRRLYWLLVGLLLTGCVPMLRPVPEPFSSPLAAPEHKLYLPVVYAGNRYGRGIATPWQVESCDDIRRMAPAWYYNWLPQPASCDTDAITLPMQWGRFDSKTCPVFGPGPLILGFNEPDQPAGKGSSGITASEAADLWHKLTVDCYPDRQFATPAVIMTHNYSGLPWLTEWWNTYNHRYGYVPRAQVLAIHCYSWTTADACIDKLTAALEWAAGHCLQGVLLTEWAVLPCAIGQAQARIENEKLRRWIEAQPLILGHAWFAMRTDPEAVWGFKPHAACDTALIDSNGALTPWGAWWTQ